MLAAEEIFPKMYLKKKVVRVQHQWFKDLTLFLNNLCSKPLHFSIEFIHGNMIAKPHSSSALNTTSASF